MQGIAVASEPCNITHLTHVAVARVIDLKHKARGQRMWVGQPLTGTALRCCGGFGRTKERLPFIRRSGQEGRLHCIRKPCPVSGANRIAAQCPFIGPVNLIHVDVKVRQI